MIIYIKELDKNDRLSCLEIDPKFIHKIIIKFIEVVNYFFVQNIDEENQIYIIPNKNKKKVYKNIKKRIKKMSKKTKRKLEVVLSERLHEFIDEFEGLNIINGRRVYLEHIEDVIENVLGDNPIEMQDLYFLANSYNSTNVNIISKLATKAKSVNIITNDIRNYSALENILLERGIIFTVSNNKRKSIKKAKLIINLDFSGEEIKKYNIFRNACIINMKEIEIKKLQCFEGIIVNNIDVKIPEEQYTIMNINNLTSNFKPIELLESLKLNESKVEITSLLGNNGNISEKERLNVQKILTK